jgi:hypothetical protein
MTVGLVDPVDPAERVPITFDFGALTEEPIAPAITVQYLSGRVDGRADLSVIKIGPAQVVGAQVRQLIGNLQDGTTYRMECQVDTPEGCRYTITANVPCRDR